MKDLKNMSTKVLFSHGGRSNLISGTGIENQIFILRTPVAIKFFHQILKNFHFGVKNKSLPTQMDLYDPDMVSYSIPLGIIILQGVLTKFQFFDIISKSGKNCSFNEKPKI